MTTRFQITYPELMGGNQIVYDVRGNPMPKRARADDKRKGQCVLELDRQQWDNLRSQGGPLHQSRHAGAVPVADVDFEASDGTLHKTAEACLSAELMARFGFPTLDEVQAEVEQLREAVQVGGDSGSIAALKAENERLNALIGQPPEGSRPDEWQPRDETCHKERLNWQGEVEKLRTHINKVESVGTIYAAAMESAGQPADSPTPETQEERETQTAEFAEDDSAVLPGQPDARVDTYTVTREPKSSADKASLIANVVARRGMKPFEAAKATGLATETVRAIVAANPETFVERSGRIYLK